MSYDSSVKIGSICSGIGGLDLAAEYVFNAETAWVSDVDSSANKVLAARFPEAVNVGDITQCDPSELPDIDVLTAGYPCQPFSLTGKRLGASDHRHIWPYIAGVIEAKRPAYVVLENVRGHLSLGFDTVLEDLAARGYDANWCLISVESVGGVHQRYRLIVLAWPSDATGERYRPRLPWGTPEEFPRVDLRRYPFPSTCDSRSPRRNYNESGYDERLDQWERIAGPRPNPVVARDNGAPGISVEFVEWMQGYPSGWVTGANVGLSEAKMLKLFGNSVCPQAAEAALWRLISQVPADVNVAA